MAIQTITGKGFERAIAETFSKICKCTINKDAPAATAERALNKLIAAKPALANSMKAAALRQPTFLLRQIAGCKRQAVSVFSQTLRDSKVMFGMY